MSLIRERPADFRPSRRDNDIRVAWIRTFIWEPAKITETAEVSEELHRLWELRAKAENKLMEAPTDEVLQAYLGHESQFPEVPPQHRRELKKLARLLASGTARQINAVTGVLDAFDVNDALGLKSGTNR